MSYDKQLKVVKDLYLDLGVELAKLNNLKPNAVKGSHKKTGCKERCKNAMNNRPNQPINLYQMHEILNQEFSIKACGDAMLSLCKDGYLQKIGLGTYKKEMLT